MSRSQLHDFDFELCSYLRSNIQQASQSFSVRADLCSDLSECLLAYIGDGTMESEADLHERVLLSTTDLVDLEVTIGAVARKALWEPYPQLHRRAVYSVREIRDQLTNHDAEEWSRQSTQFAARLERRNLRLVDGIMTIGNWIRCVRRYLFAMGHKDLVPIPEGRFPTPALPTPLEHRHQRLDVDLYVELMREAIQKHPAGRDASVNDLIRAAGVNRQHGLEALECLRASNEYRGKRRPAIYRRQQRPK